MKPYYYKGLGGGKGFCGLDILRTGADAVTVILTELPANPGTPVADFFAGLATLLYDSQIRYLKVLPEQVIWIAHQPRNREGDEETYDQIILEWDGKGFSSPRGIRIPREKWREYRLIATS